MSIFDDIKTGLNQAIDYEKGKGVAKVTVFSVQPKIFESYVGTLRKKRKSLKRFA